MYGSIDEAAASESPAQSACGNPVDSRRFFFLILIYEIVKKITCCCEDVSLLFGE